MEKVLTIGIPTYNRSGYLDICLNSIFSQINDVEHLVDIVISDNASNDDTAEVINKYRNQGFSFTYLRNDFNIGLDRNFANLYENSNSKYIWMIADDDFIFPNTIKRFFEVLEQFEFGVLYLNNYWYGDSISLDQFNFDEKTKITVYDDPIRYLERVNYWITFTSGNIINKDIVKDKIDIYQFDKTMFLLLGWIIPAIFQGRPNLVLENVVVGCKSENTGGYKLYEVFGKNLNFIMDSLIAKGYDHRMKQIINDHLLETFFPAFLRRGTKSFKNENYEILLIKVFWQYSKFWKYVFPILLKKRIRSIFNYVQKAYR